MIFTRLNRRIRLMAAWLALTPALSTAQVHLTVDPLAAPTGADTLAVTLTLANPFDAIGGLELQLAAADTLLTLHAVLTTERTAGWKVAVRKAASAGSRATIRLYEPSGLDLPTGEGPVLVIIYTVPAAAARAFITTVEVLALTVSDPFGAALPAGMTAGVVAVGPVAQLSLGAATGDLGDTVAIALELLNPLPVAAGEITLAWDNTVLHWLGGSAGERIKSTTLNLTFVQGDPAGPGRLLLRWTGGDHKAIPAGSGSLAQLQFVIADSTWAGVTTLTVLPDQSRLEAPGQIPMVIGSWQDAQVAVYPGYLPSPSGLRSELDTDGWPRLIWGAADHVDGEGPVLTAYALYRSLADGPSGSLIPLAGTPPGVRQYTDYSAQAGSTYRYSVSAEYDSLYLSAPSRPVGASRVEPVEIAIMDTLLQAGAELLIPIAISAGVEVGAFRFGLAGLPPEIREGLRATISRRVPPDWSIALDSPAPGLLEVAGSSPGGNPIPAGAGALLQIHGRLMPEQSHVMRVDLLGLEIFDAQGRPLPVRAVSGTVRLEAEAVTLRIGTGGPVAPGEAGEMALYMENSRPVVALQLLIEAPAPDLLLLEALPGDRLPQDATIRLLPAGPGLYRLIVASLSNTPIAAGAGRIAAIGVAVAGEALPGEKEVTLSDIFVTGENLQIEPQAAVTGYFPVGRITAVFAPLAVEGRPGRLVRLPVSLVSTLPLCGFQMQLHYPLQWLELIRVAAGGRLPAQGKLEHQPTETGLAVAFTGTPNRPLAAGSGVLFELVFNLRTGAPAVEILAVELTAVAAEGCAGETVFALGQPAEIRLTADRPVAAHFADPLPRQGYTHYIKVRRATIGGVFLRPGDELALFDETAWTDDRGSSGPLMVGSGRVAEDGSVEVLAALGLAGAEGTPYLPGARPGNRIVYRAWARGADDVEASAAAGQYALGSGIWGENGGLTIIEQLQFADPRQPAPAAGPDSVEVGEATPNPFSDSTSIRFGLPRESQVEVAVYDLLGRKLVVLHDGQTAAGYHQVSWDGRLPGGEAVRSGMLFLQLRTPERTYTRKVLLLR